MKPLRNLNFSLAIKFCFCLLSSLLIAKAEFAQENQIGSNIQVRIYLQADSIIYVDDNNTAGPWTGTRTHPFHNIPEGLSLADSGVTVFVLPGIYQISSNLLVNNGVNLFLDTNITIRFGVNAGMNVNGHLLAFGARNDSIVFTTTATGTTWKGIRFNNTRDSELRYCKIENCTGTADGKGGALYVKNGSPTFFKCRIQNNSAIYGGGIFCDSLAKPLIKECVIANNNAVSGGGIFSNCARPMIVDNLIANNHTTGRMGGGGIAIYNQTVLSQATMQPILAGNMQPDPLPLHTGGLLSNVQYSQQPNPEETGSFTNSSRTFPVVRGNTISGNASAFGGGGIVLDNNESVIYNNAINSNTANQDGGGICSKSNSTYLIKWNEISDNHATRYGGGLFSVRCDSSELSRNLLVSNYALKGGAVFLDSCDLDFYNNTISANTSPQGGSGLYNNNGVIQAYNNIFWKNLPADGTPVMGSDIIASYNDIENGFPGPWNFSEDPVFVDTTSRNFNLRFSSPCINTGKPGSEPDPDSTNADRGVFYNPTNVGSAMIGYYTINNAPGSTADYSSFNAAVSDLISRHVAGPVTFQVSPGTYIEQVRIPEIVGASLNNPVEFNSLNQDSTSVILTYASTTSALNYTVKLDSADYITFRQITMKATGATYGRVVWFLNGANNNKILNSRIVGVQNTSTSTDFTLIFSNGNNDNNNIFSFNVLNYGSDGFYFLGVSSTSLESGTQITNNLFFNQYYTAIDIRNQNAPSVRKNTILSNSANSSYSGVYAYVCDNGLQISGNKINLTGGNGLNLVYCDGTANSKGLISNNFIQSGTNGDGIVCGNSSYQKFYFNSVNKTGTASSYYQYSSSYIDVKNNIFANRSTGFVVYLNGGSNNSMDYNDLFQTGTDIGYNQGTSTSYSDLAAWRIGTGFDLHSVSVDPNFVSSTDLHVVNNQYLNNKGLSVSDVVDDFDGDPRNPTHPDIGADEFKPSGLDGSLTWLAPVSPVASGPQIISMILENTGGNTINEAIVHFTDGLVVGVQTFSNLNLATEAADTLNFYSYNLTGIASLLGFIVNVNGVADDNQHNDTTAIQYLSAPLSGTYTIDSSLPTSNRNFHCFYDAAQTLNLAGVSGLVTINVEPGIYNEQIELKSISGASEVNRINFCGVSDDSTQVELTYASTSGNYDYTLKLTGTDYCTFKNMTIANTGSTYSRVLYVSAQAHYNYFERNQIIGTQSTSTTNYTIYMTQNSNNHNVFNGNLIKYGGSGLFTRGLSTNQEAGTIIQNNRFLNQYNYGIYAEDQYDLLISGNILSSNSTNSGYLGIELYRNNGNLRVLKNKITTTNGVGIRINSCNGTASIKALHANNFVQSGNNGDAFVCNNSTYQKICFNSVNETGTNSAFSIFNSSNNEMKNNIFSNHSNGYAINISGGSNNSFDYNNLYTTGLVVAFNSGTSVYYSDLLAWQTTTGFDLHSVSVEPNFYSPTNLNITNNQYLNNQGIPVAGVTDDVDGNPRNLTHPDIGADEFNPSGLDGSISWLSPVSPNPSWADGISVLLENTGGTTITQATLAYSLGGNPSYQTFSNLNLTSETSDTLTFATFFLITGIVEGFGYIVNINGTSDDNQTNDTTAIQLIGTPLNGIYTINPALPTIGTNFSSFTQAVTALKCCGVGGPVTFNVYPSTYNEQILISPITGTSANNTITFQSFTRDSTSVILTWNSTVTASNYTVKLYGADYIIFKEMTIKATGSGFGRVIEITNGASYNQFLNNQIVGIQNTSTSVDFSLIYSAGSNDNNNIFANNIMTFGSYGFYYTGVSTSSLESGTQILNNTLTNQKYRSIYCENQNAIMLHGNLIASNSSDFVGIFIIYCDNQIQVIKNRVTTVSGTGIVLNYCDGTASLQGMITNNFIKAGDLGNGLYIYYSNYQNCYFNSINRAGTSSSYPVIVLATSNYIVAKNNIFSHHSGGYAIYINAGANNNSDYNNLFSTGSTVGWKSVAYSTLSAWQTGTGFDLHSVSVPPNFISQTDLHIDTNSHLVFAGAPISTIHDDIDGEARNPTQPDIGADEFQQKAIVTTSAISSLTSSSANSGGNVISSPASPVSGRGVCWGISPYPSITGNHTTNGSGLGEFISMITGLNENTTYHVRSYATNDSGTYYGGQVIFKTPCSVISTFPWNEGFENAGQIPECWTQEQINNSGVNWIFNNGSGNGNPSSAHGGTYNACLKDFTAGSNKTRLISPPLNLTMISEPELTFWHTQTAWSSDQDHLSVYYKISEGGTWNLLSTYTNNIPSWTQETISLPNPSSSYFIAFEGNAKYGYGVCIDDVSVTGSIAGTPIVTTSPISGITNTSAVSGGNVTSSGAAPVITRGVCWSTGNNPTIQDSHSVNGSGTGTFISNISGLAINTTYYLRAYATNSIGTSYGNILTFTTPAIPSLQASNILITSSVAPTMTFNWTDGNGAKRIVFMKQDTTGTPLPSGSVSYTASTAFGSGTQIGTSGWYCVFNGTTHPGGITVSNLLTNTRYRIMVCEYNEISGSRYFNTSTASNNPRNQSTCPVITPTITGVATACLATSNQPYSTQTGMSNYTWSVTGGTVTAGAGTATITVTWASSGAKTVCVSYTASSGCQSVQTCKNVNVLANPGDAGTITGTSSVCLGATGVPFSVATIPNATSYQWTVPDGWTIATGANTRSITLNFPSIAGNGAITVKGVNQCASGASSGHSIAINPELTGTLSLMNMNILPGRDLCFSGDNITTAGSGTSFIIQNTGKATLIADTYVKLLTGTKTMPGGKLHAIATTYCIPCVTSKAAISLVQSGDYEELQPSSGFSDGSFFRVFPNPTTGEFTLEILNITEGPLTSLIRIHGMLGEEILREEWKGKSKDNISLRDKPGGIYLVTVMYGEKMGTVKIVKR